jgi:hypothetical protein
VLRIDDRVWALMKDLSKLILLSIALLQASIQAAANDVTPNYDVGVYYFPGWLDDQRGAPAAKPWSRIKSYPEREPLLGWYREGSLEVAEQHIEWMSSHGIDYVVFDWYWDGKPMLEHAVEAFMKANNSRKMRFTLLWSNHSKVPENIEQFTSMIHYWIKHYFPKDNYLRIENKPTVFVFSQQELRDNAKKFGYTTAALIAKANQIARDAGYDGIFFIAGASAIKEWVNEHGPQSGFSAFSAYNYHRGFSGTFNPLSLPSHSYRELDLAYQQNWDWILKNSPLPYIIPTISGWDMRPWGGSSYPLHDNSFGTPDEFEGHLMAAKQRIDRYPSKTMGMTVICCWNEFGEGSYIEPTKKDGFKYLERVRKVFGGQ